MAVERENAHQSNQPWALCVRKQLVRSVLTAQYTLSALPSLAAHLTSQAATSLCAVVNRI